METHAQIEGKDKRDAEYRIRILDAARQLFDRHGIDSVNMYQIAQEAGVGQGTLYRRYGHVGEICSDLLMQTTEQALDELESEWNGTAADTPALEQMYAAIVRTVHFLEQNADLLITISCMYAGKKDYLPQKRPVAARLYSLFSSQLARAAELGETSGIDVALTANCLLAAISPEQYRHHRTTLGYSQERYLAGIRRLFIDGIRKGDIAK